MNLLELARRALAEDRVAMDVTTGLLESYLRQLQASQSFHSEKTDLVSFRVIAKEDGVFAGQDWVTVLSQLSELGVSQVMQDGRGIKKGDVVVQGQAPWQNVLSVERTLLNELQHLCGVATLTKKYVTAVESHWSHFGFTGQAAPGIYHTRKTLPLHRELEVSAVLAGGGKRHRMNLAERFLAKDNHKDQLKAYGVAYEDWARFVLESTQAQEALFEADTPDEAIKLAQVGVRHLLLDNFTPDEIRRTLLSIPPQVEIEISGGLNLQTITDYVFPGVHRLSIGALTHSVKALDLSLEWSSSHLELIG